MSLANKLTISRILMVPLFIACFYIEPALPWWNGLYWIAAVIFILAGITDVLDGNVARKTGSVSDFGKLMDPIADKLIACSAFIMLVATQPQRLHPLFAIVFIGREMLIAGFRLVSAKGGTVIGASWLGKAKTLTQDIMVVVMLLNNPLFGTIGVPFDWIMACVAALFTLWSAWDYIWQNRKAVDFR